MDRIILINPNRMKPAVGPVGVDYLDLPLRKAGFRPYLMDFCFQRAYREQLAESLKTLRPTAIGISIRNLDDCYFASQSFELEPARAMVRFLKTLTDSPVILGGVGYSIAPVACLRYTGADFGIWGDGEVALPHLLRAIQSGHVDEHEIPGLVLPGGTPPRPAFMNMDNYPTPRRDLADNPRYFREGGQGNIETKRGCPEKCIFCADPVAKGRKSRMRPAEGVVEELESLVQKGIHTFHFCDSEFNIPRHHAEAVCREIIKRKLDKKIKFYVYASPRPFDQELAGLMAQAGCSGICFGVDSASDEMLSRLKRRHRAKDLEKIMSACRKAGITVIFDLLLAGPGENRKTLRQTISMMKKIKPHRVGVSMGVRIVPGTELAQMVLTQGSQDENPNLRGCTKDNPDFLFPVFYFSEKLGPEGESYLNDLIGDDPRFFFAKSDDVKQTYNYNRNLPLVRAIRRGQRGAYWDILRKMAEDSWVKNY
jgi:radical SAM superfamily enzyme YgiQ (UPF0313 family)